MFWQIARDFIGICLFLLQLDINFCRESLGLSQKRRIFKLRTTGETHDSTN